MQFVDLDNYGLRVVNFEHIFTSAYKHIVNDLYVYDKHHDYNARSQDTKRIYYYYLIKQLCDFVCDCKTTNRVIVYYSEKDIKCDYQMCSNKRSRSDRKTDRSDEFRVFMSRFFKQIKNILPIKVHHGPVRFNTFVQYYNTNKGRYLEIINVLRESKATPTNMEKFKKFSTKYGLSYLTKHYVDSVKIKCMMYK